MKAGKAFTTAICAILVGATSSPQVWGQIASAPRGTLADRSGNVPPPSSAAVVCPLQDASGDVAGFGQPCCEPRWTATADFVILDRVGGVPYTLVATEPSSVHSSDLYNTPAAEVLNATDLHQGFAGGPRLSLIHRGDDEGDLEFSYFQIDGWDAVRSIGPTPDEWLVMKAPGGFVQEQDNKNDQMMVWGCTSRLYNAELNMRWNLWPRVTVLAGFRWVNLTEELQGNLPPERTVPFWDTQAKNNLYGFQIGAEGKLFEQGRFSIGCTGKAGLFDDHAQETTTVSIFRMLFAESAATDHAAFVGEAGVQCKYQLTRRLSLRAGYEAMWLEGVALAPGQIPETCSHSDLDPTKIYVRATGVDCSSGVFYHGATAGLEYSF